MYRASMSIKNTKKLKFDNMYTHKLNIVICFSFIIVKHHKINSKCWSNLSSIYWSKPTIMIVYVVYNRDVKSKNSRVGGTTWVVNLVQSF